MWDMNVEIVDRILSFIYHRLNKSYQKRSHLYFRRKYSVSETFEFNGTDIRLYGEGEIYLGDQSYMGSYSTMQAGAGCKIIVGNKCMISHNVRMYTCTPLPDQDFIDGGSEKLKNKIGDIIIGDGVWIGVNVFINPGVSIENNSIIGANSVVTKDVEANSIVGGVPARLIRMKKIG